MNEHYDATDFDYADDGYDDEYPFEEVINEAEEAEYEAKYGYAARQAKPLTEQTLDDFDQFFQHCEDLLFVFLSYGPGQVNDVQCCLFTAIEMAGNALVDSDCPPEPAIRKLWIGNGRNPFPRSQVADAVRARVQEMDRRKADYVLIWYLEGEERMHVAGDLWGSEEALRDFICVEVEDYLRG